MVTTARNQMTPAVSSLFPPHPHQHFQPLFQISALPLWAPHSLEHRKRDEKPNEGLPNPLSKNKGIFKFVNTISPPHFPPELWTFFSTWGWNWRIRNEDCRSYPDFKILRFTSKLYRSAKNEQTIPSVLYCQKHPIKKMNVYPVIAENCKLQCLYM